MNPYKITGGQSCVLFKKFIEVLYIGISDLPGDFIDFTARYLQQFLCCFHAKICQEGVEGLAYIAFENMHQIVGT